MIAAKHSSTTRPTENGGEKGHERKTWKEPTGREVIKIQHSIYTSPKTTTLIPHLLLIKLK